MPESTGSADSDSASGGLPWLNGFESNDYSKHWLSKRIEDQTQKRIISGWIRPGDACLELGGGFGRITRILEPHFRDITMMDFAKRNLQMAKKNLAKARIVRSDVSTLPFKDSAFDTVVMIRVIHLLPDPAKTMNEILRVIMDKGTLILSIPNLLMNYLLREFESKLVPPLRHLAPTFGPAVWPLGERPYLRPHEFLVPKEFKLRGIRGTGLFDNYLGKKLNRFPSLSLVDVVTSPLWYLKLDIFFKFEVSKGD